jgi:membrane protein required for colicin V production
MAEVPLTAFDVATILVVGLSVLVAYLRGAIREMLAIGSWLGAGVAAYYAFPYARELARRTMETDWLADAVALCVVFVVPLIAFKVAAAALTDRLPGGHLQTVDRIAGVVFGIVRGAVIICAAYLALTFLVGREEQPEWIREALVLPYVEDGAALLGRLVPEDLADRGPGTALRVPTAPGRAWRALVRGARTPAGP